MTRNYSQTSNALVHSRLEQLRVGHHRCRLRIRNELRRCVRRRDRRTGGNASDDCAGESGACRSNPDTSRVRSRRSWRCRPHRCDLDKSSANLPWCRSRGSGYIRQLRREIFVSHHLQRLAAPLRQAEFLGVSSKDASCPPGRLATTGGILYSADLGTLLATCPECRLFVQVESVPLEVNEHYGVSQYLWVVPRASWSVIAY